jgi:hypothetical protein
MSVLPSGQPLTSVVPDLESLFEDPAGYLKAGAVSIGPRKMYGLAAAFGLPGILFLVSFFLTAQPEAEYLALGIGLLLGGSVWLGWSLMLSGHELVLYAEGVEVRYRGSVVWCPWALFNAEGAPQVPETDSPMVGLTLPINPSAIPFVELRREETPIAHGAQIQSRQLLFTSRSEVVLPARYAVVADQLGELLLFLGQKLGQHLPRGTPPPEAYRMDAIDQAMRIEPDEAGWITVPLTRLRFPWRCCACGCETRNTRRVAVLAQVDRVLGPFAFQARNLEVELPLCPNCDEQFRERVQRAGQRGLLLGVVLVPLVIASIGLALEAERPLVGLLALLGLAVGGVAGFLIGTTLTFQPPVQFRNYSPSRGTVQLRFRNPDQERPFLEALRRKEEGEKMKDESKQS